MTNRKIKRLLSQCRHPLSVGLIIDPNKGWFASVAYEGCQPTIVRSQTIPESVEEFLNEAIEQFDLEKNNELASQYRLQNTDNEVKPVQLPTKDDKASSNKTKTKTEAKAKKLANPLF